jgi:hypothetical protein
MRRPTHILLVLLLLFPACKLSCFAPRAETLDAPITAKLGEGRKSEGGATFDHQIYDALLRRHVRYDEGLVDYAGLKEDRDDLARYLGTIAAADLQELDGDEQMALLINAYNAFTLELILERYPDIESIKDVDDPWGTKRWNVGGEMVSLDGIEHGLLRPVFEDPRIHFAVNCASIGCPPLADFAFTADAIDRQLEQVTTKTLNNRRYATMEEGELHLTRIFQWYGPDFTRAGWSPTAKSIPEFVARYGSDEVRELVAEKGAETPVSYLEYDWGLNDVPSL